MNVGIFLPFLVFYLVYCRPPSYNGGVEGSGGYGQKNPPVYPSVGFHLS